MKNGKLKKIITRYDYLLGENKYWFREILFSYKPGTILKEEFSIRTNKYRFACIDLKIVETDLNNDYCYNAARIDITDFSKGITTRYNIASPYLSKILKLAERTLPSNKLPKGLTHRVFFHDQKRIIHTGHMTLDNRFICATHGYCIYFIETETNKVHFYPEDYDSKLYIYSPTGCFSSNYRYFYFVRWSYEDAIAALADNSYKVKCEVGRFDIQSKSIEIIYKLDYKDDVHTIACSKDDKFLVFVDFDIYDLNSFSNDLKIEDIETHLASEDRFTEVVTLDMEKKIHWETKVPIPSPAHFRFDPDDIYVFYMSAHNYYNTMKYGVFLGGYGGIVKMRIENDKTNILWTYSDEEAIRVTQHAMFKKDNKKYIAITTTPHKFVIVEADTMKRVNSVYLKDEPLPNFTDKKYILIGAFQFPLGLTSSIDNSFIVACNNRTYYVYDIKKGELVEDHNLEAPPGRTNSHITPVGL